MTASQGHTGQGPGNTGARRWTVGADALEPRWWSGETVEMPTGRLHAVSDEGLIVGRAACLAPVILLDPRDWQWPDDGGEEWPLCWICEALTW